MSDLEKAARLTLEVMGLIGADLVCDAAHHKKADRHGIGEPCPIQAKWHHAFAALRQALEQPAQQEHKPWCASLSALMFKPRPCDCKRVPLPPPQRKPWVGLTREEKQHIIDANFGGSRADCMDEAERILRRKNT